MNRFHYISPAEARRLAKDSRHHARSKFLFEFVMFILGVASVFLIIWTIFAAVAKADDRMYARIPLPLVTLCTHREGFDDYWRDDTGERPVWQGIATSGELVRFYQNDLDEWSFIIFLGKSADPCVFMVGEDAELLPSK